MNDHFHWTLGTPIEKIFWDGLPLKHERREISTFQGITCIFTTLSPGSSDCILCRRIWDLTNHHCSEGRPVKKIIGTGCHWRYIRQRNNHLLSVWGVCFFVALLAWNQGLFSVGGSGLSSSHSHGEMRRQQKRYFETSYDWREIENKRQKESQLFSLSPPCSSTG